MKDSRENSQLSGVEQCSVLVLTRRRRKEAPVPGPKASTVENVSTPRRACAKPLGGDLVV